MIINGTSVRGIYLYDPEIQYERGDFVVEGEKIYICKAAPSDSGFIPSENPNYFKTYLSDEIAGEEDFKNYEEGLSDDKLVSAVSLSRILSSYMSGFDEKGIINNSVTDDGKIWIGSYFQNNKAEELATNPEYTSPLEQIMCTPSLNNAIFNVSRNVVGAEINYLTNGNPVILRQYTYKKDSIYVRIQELIDPASGEVWYRYGTSDSGFQPTDTWKSCYVSDSFKETIDGIRTYYASECNKIQNERMAMYGSFRFRKAVEESKLIYGLEDQNASDNMTVLFGSDDPNIRGKHRCIIPYTFSNVASFDDFYITLNIYKKENQRTYRNESITLDLNSIQTRKIFETELGSEVTVVKNEATFTITTDNGGYVESLYYREPYGGVSTSDIGTSVDISGLGIRGTDEATFTITTDKLPSNGVIVLSTTCPYYQQYVNWFEEWDENGNRITEKWSWNYYNFTYYIAVSDLFQSNELTQTAPALVPSDEIMSQTPNMNMTGWKKHEQINGFLTTTYDPIQSSVTFSLEGQKEKNAYYELTEEQYMELAGELVEQASGPRRSAPAGSRTPDYSVIGGVMIAESVVSEYQNKIVAPSAGEFKNIYSIGFGG